MMGRYLNPIRPGFDESPRCAAITCYYFSNHADAHGTRHQLIALTQNGRRGVCGGDSAVIRGARDVVTTRMIELDDRWHAMSVYGIDNHPIAGNTRVRASHRVPRGPNPARVRRRRFHDNQSDTATRTSRLVCGDLLRLQTVLQHVSAMRGGDNSVA